MMRGKRGYFCEEYPEYRFTAIPNRSTSHFKVTYERGMDTSTLMVDLLVGQTITLTPMGAAEPLLLQLQERGAGASDKKRKFEAWDENHVLLFKRRKTSATTSTQASNDDIIMMNASAEESKPVRIKEDHTILCKIMTIDQSTNGRRSDIFVERL